MVANARADTVSREVLRHVEFEGKVALGRLRDHFLCTSLDPTGNVRALTHRNSLNRKCGTVRAASTATGERWSFVGEDS